MKSLNTIAVLMICLLLVAGSAWAAERQVTVTPVTSDAQVINPVKSAAGVCQFGNLNPAAYAITDWIYGAESYKYLFEADAALCGDCPAGFTVEAVHLYMQFGVEDVPVTFDAYVDFEESDWDEALGCWVPGPQICVSPTYSVTIDAAGMYDISLPIESCECAYFGYTYGVGMTFVTAFDSYPDIITDASPVGCTSWNDYGLGWLDLLDFGFPGEIKMFADIVCCDPPVATEQTSFDELKALFR